MSRLKGSTDLPPSVRTGLRRQREDDMLHQKIVESPFKLKYGNYIGGEWREPISGKYFENVSPVTGGKICDIPRSDEKDINAAIDAAHAAKDKWGRTSTTERSNILMKIAQR